MLLAIDYRFHWIVRVLNVKFQMNRLLPQTEHSFPFLTDTGYYLKTYQPSCVVLWAPLKTSEISSALFFYCVCVTGLTALQNSLPTTQKEILTIKEIKTTGTSPCWMAASLGRMILGAHRFWSLILNTPLILNSQ